MAGTQSSSTPAQQDLQRIGFLVVLPPLLRQLGINPKSILAEANLEPDALNDPEGTIPYEAMGVLVRAAAEQAQCPHLGLLIGQQIGPASLGLVGELMQNAPTLGAALRDFAAHQHRNAHGGAVYLSTQQDRAVFGYAVYHPDVEGLPLIHDGAAAAARNIVRHLVRPRPSLGMEVLLARSKPQDPGPYISALGPQIHFNAEQTGVSFPRDWLAQPVEGADPARRTFLERHVNTVFWAGDLDLMTQLRRALRIGLLIGGISAAKIAAQLGMSDRTLHRRLAGSDMNFQAALDQARSTFAEQLLANTRISLAQIAYILRYRESSTFTRAFLRWSGTTPSDWRSRHQIKAPPPDARMVAP